MHRAISCWMIVSLPCHFMFTMKLTSVDSPCQSVCSFIDLFLSVFWLILSVCLVTKLVCLLVDLVYLYLYLYVNWSCLSDFSDCLSICLSVCWLTLSICQLILSVCLSTGPVSLFFLTVHLSDWVLTDSIGLSVHRMLVKLLSTAGVHPQMITVFIDGDFEVCASVITHTCTVKQGSNTQA